ncbi:hypothetical protein GCM10011491_46990 [Brucella endophytica]|uniref:Uncharacterized protein n=2 Tax=Brucella endophytica TaxID=1963359 RepID=A0A916SUH5_9HYPH|nr:hypothetical protein GCM10011491_46990 [Brucella endophytica]
MLLVPWKNAPASWGRKALEKATLERHLKPLYDKLKAEAAQKLGKMAVKKAASGWMKLVPVLNVLSTAYDLYDIGSTGYDLYKSYQDAMSKYQGDVYRVQPDIAIDGKDGELKDIYDFKFDKDRWRRGQSELYDEGLRNAGVQKANVKQNGEVSQNTCACDGKARKSGVAGA